MDIIPKANYVNTPTKKLAKKLMKNNFGVFDLFDLKDLGLSKDQIRIFNGASAIVLSAMKDKQKKLGKRKQFAKLTKENILKKQKNRCKLCDKKSDIWDFDHIDEDKANNDISNCQALCPNCHAKITRSK